MIIFFFSGKMYFTYQNENATEFLIGKTTLAGTQLKVLYNSSNNIESLFLDHESNALYFVYGTLGAIKYINLTDNTVNT